MAEEAVATPDALDVAVEAYNSGKESTSTTVETTAASVETPKAVETKAEETPEATPAVGRSDKLQKLIDSKGGEDKFVESVYETYNSSSKLAKEIAELKQLVSQAPQRTEEEPDPQEYDDDDSFYSEASDWYKNQLQALDAQETNLNTQKTETGRALLNSRQEIAKLEGQFEEADDFKKTQIEARLERARARHDSLVDKFNSFDSLKQQIDNAKFEANTRLKGIDREISRAKTNQKQLEAANAAYRDNQLNVFETSIAEIAALHGIAPDSEVYTDLYETVRAKAVLTLRSNPGKPPIDLAAFAKKTGEMYAKIHGFGKKEALQTLSEKKIAATPAVTQKVSPPTAVPNYSASFPEPKDPKSAQGWRERAASLMGHLERGQR